MSEKIILTLRTVDVDSDGFPCDHDLRRSAEAGIMVEADCKSEPESHMMELAVADLMVVFDPDESDSRAIAAGHDIDSDIVLDEETNHIDVYSLNCQAKIEPEFLSQELLEGLQSAEWFKSLKTGRCECKFLVRLWPL